mmetsp:Transcript_64069/g.126735  ORF Transcript_64069/g.126735 Transcript_64069/m.126735 type:complete len:301 (-) Transcript_64069:751-1653(-)
MGRRSCCRSCSSRRAAVTMFCASSSTMCAFSRAWTRPSWSDVGRPVALSFNLRTAASASSIFTFTTSTMLARLRLPDSAWKALTLSMPASIRCRNLSNSMRAASPAPSAIFPTSTILTATYLAASARAACAEVEALSIRLSTSAASTGGMVSRPMRNGASVSRILCSMSLIFAMRSAACFTMGMAATRDSVSSTVRCALSINACEASARDCKSIIFSRTVPFSPATRPATSRNVGARVARAARSASFVSRTSLGFSSSGFKAADFANGSAIIAALSQSTSTVASRDASSPKSFSAWSDSS